MDNRMISFLYFFNIKKDFYECHEYGEHLWLELGRPLILKGFIQAAVCLYHLSNGNLRGATTMWSRAKSYLKEGLPDYEQIDVEKLIQDIEEVFSIVQMHRSGNMVTPESIQALHLPEVQIRILNPDICALLPDFTPDPLVDDNS